MEVPTYLGALQAFNVYGAESSSVPSDDDGLRSGLAGNTSAIGAEVHVRVA